MHAEHNATSVTNAWIQILKQPAGKLEHEVLSRPPSEIALCSIVKAELWHGANKYERRDPECPF